MHTKRQTFLWVETMSKKRKNRVKSERINGISISTCVILLQLLAAGMFDSGCVQAQSTVVATGPASSGKIDAIRNSLSDAFLRTELFLSQPIDWTQLTVEQFAERLRANGIAVAVDYAGLDINESKVLKLANSPSLAQSLGNGLATFEATFSILHNGTLKIISTDDVDELEYFINVIYDISSLATNWYEAEDVLASVQDTVWTDSWLDTGSGQGTIMVASNFAQTGQYHLVVGQSFQAQMAVRRTLNDLARLGGGSKRTGKIPQIRGGVPSSTVALPGHERELRRSRYGFQGGVFSVPSADTQMTKER